MSTINLDLPKGTNQNFTMSKINPIMTGRVQGLVI